MLALIHSGCDVGNTNLVENLTQMPGAMIVRDSVDRLGNLFFCLDSEIDAPAVIIGAVGEGWGYELVRRPAL